jgi:nitrite reductase (NO-forming)
MVDHHFANASQGAIGLISTLDQPKAVDLEHHNMEASSVPSNPFAADGKMAFETKCLACHSIGQGKKLGPDLVGVTQRRTDPWLMQWLAEPEKMLLSDASAKAMLKEYNNIPMPNQGLSKKEISQYLAYFHWIDDQAKDTKNQASVKAKGH